MADECMIRVARAVERGVRWLKGCAHGITGARDIAITTSALVAAERNPSSHLVQKLARALLELQLPNGSWSDELWDTTWAIQALLGVGYRKSFPAIARALSFLVSTQDPVAGTWYEELFETISVLQLLFELDPSEARKRSAKAVNWLVSLQRSDGLVVNTQYTGMAVSLFQKNPGDAVQGKSFVENGIKCLRDTLSERGIWTRASWSNFYCLSAFLDAGCSLSDPAVRQGVDWLLDTQEPNGRWMHVSEIHDTATAVQLLARLLSVPLVDLATPQLAVIHVSRENGTLRVDYLPPGLGTIVPSERMKLSDSVRRELGINQQRALSVIGRTRSMTAQELTHRRGSPPAPQDELTKIGQYTYGHLIPSRIQTILENSEADHLRLDIDERLIDLPWELIHDGREFLCLQYATGRRLVSDQPLAIGPSRARTAKEASALVVADPTEDLPAADLEGKRVAELLRQKCGMRVDDCSGRDLKKKDFLLSFCNYDLIHYAGHADHDPDSPDESCLVMYDGQIQAFEIARFLKNPPPSVVFLNACWSAEEQRDPESYSPVVRGLGRTFMYGGVTAFIGYLVPVADESATRFALEFYSWLSRGQSIGESLRLSRVDARARGLMQDLTWASAILYGEPSARVFEPPLQFGL